LKILSNYDIILYYLTKFSIFAGCDFLKKEKQTPKAKTAKRNKVEPVNSFILGLVYFTVRFYYFLCGVHIKAVNKVSKPQSPAIILCNHGSFIDFIFAAKLLRKYKPHFIIARLYFYNKYLRWLLRKVGGFPKSMFALDAESTKNCITVLRQGELLAMMPEARLSTAGEFEDIQDSTYSFIKKSAVPVYTVKFGGDYLADPKWGKGFRRGSIVEAEFDILYTAEEIKNLTTEEIKKGVEDRLYYDEFEWLSKRPDLKYHSPRMAEGLENILTLCPVCKQKHTLKTHKNKVYCEKCGYLTAIDNRYGFDTDFKFKNLKEWYRWQKDLLEQEICSNEDFKLVSKVELRSPTANGNGLTRFAGEGVCTLSRDGLKYCGTKDGETVELTFTLERIYRLLFGAGENFEIYNGAEILYFVPNEKRSAVDWYTASKILYDRFVTATVN
jgi:1-acyl-sn-glycerol-3-phosphate acyltransferase